MAKRTSKRTIRAAKKPEPTALRILASAPVQIEAAKGEGKRPTFDIVGYTGAVMSVDQFFSPVVVDLTGLKAEGQEIPALFSHDMERIVGQTDSIKIGSDVRLAGTITGDNEDATEVVTQAKNGFRWRASIGATITRREFLESGKTATVNGREVTGPLVIAREAQLVEISFVSIGADNQTSADVAASLPTGSLKGTGTMNPFEEWLKAKGIDPAALEDPVRATLQAAYNAEQGKDKKDGKTTDAAGQKLEQIFAENRAETERQNEITQITARALAERPGMADDLERMSKAAIEARATTPQEYELLILRATRATATVATRIQTAGGVRASAKTIEAALCRAGGLDDMEKHFEPRILEAMDARFRSGLTLCEVLAIGARENGWHGESVRGDVEGVLRAAFPPRHIQASQGFSTISLPTILGNVANKFLAAGFNAVESTWRAIADRRSVPDFKAITNAALTGGFTYLEVGPSGELVHATVGELTYPGQAKTYGRMLAVTRKDIINDDLGALTGIPRKLGRGAALGLNRDFWTVFLNNSAFFTSGRGNFSSGAGTVLSIASLDAGQALFLNQTDPDGDPVAIQPSILLVPNALFVNANNFMNSTQVVNNTTANTTTLSNNPFAGKYQVVSSSYLSNTNFTGNSTTAWYLIADPADIPVIQVQFLNGREQPTVESAEADFNTLGMQFRGYFDYGVSQQEYRAGVKMAGA